MNLKTFKLKEDRMEITEEIKNRILVGIQNQIKIPDVNVTVNENEFLVVTIKDKMYITDINIDYAFYYISTEHYNFVKFVKVLLGQASKLQLEDRYNQIISKHVELCIDLDDPSIMSASDAAKQWGITDSRIRQVTDKFPKGTIRKLGKQWVVLERGMKAVFGDPRKNN
jgi:hypothetical protein